MDEKMNIQDLVALLAERHGMSKRNAESFVKEFFLLIEEALEKDKYVKVKGLGVFKLIEVESRESVNVNTGERFEIQSHTKISFTPDPALKDLINRPFSHFETVVLNDDIICNDTIPEKDQDSDEFTETDNDYDKISEKSAESEKVDNNYISASQDTDGVLHTEINKNAEPNVEEKISATLEEETEKRVTPESISDNNKDSNNIIQTSNPQTRDNLYENELESFEEDPIEKHDSSTMKYFIAIVFFVILLCGGAIAFMYFPEISDSFSKPTSSNKTEKLADKKVLNSDSLLDRDTIKNSIQDTVSKSKVTKEQIIEKENTDTKIVQNEIKENKEDLNQPLTLEPSAYKIVGTKTIYAIKKGESLVKVSLLFYGTKKMWPLIVKHNSDKIKSPDHVPYGTKVKIPELALR